MVEGTSRHTSLPLTTLFTRIVRSRSNGALLALGAAGTWDAGMVLAARAPVVEGNTIKLWYGGFSLPHDSDDPGQASAIGLATLRKDGFVSLDAGAMTGSILTKPFTNAGGPLWLNYHTNSSAGSVKVEVLDEYNNVLPGYSQSDCVPLTGNSITQAVTWGAQSQLPAGRSYLRLRFLVQNASVYSFMAGSNAVPVDEPPTLGYARQGSSLFLSWPTNSAGYSLRYVTNVAGTNWLPTSPAPVVVGGQYMVTNVMTNTGRFYRLRKP